jgi:hypothetical protein
VPAPRVRSCANYAAPQERAQAIRAELCAEPLVAPPVRGDLLPAGSLSGSPGGPTSGWPAPALPASATDGTGAPLTGAVPIGGIRVTPGARSAVLGQRGASTGSGQGCEKKPTTLSRMKCDALRLGVGAPQAYSGNLRIVFERGFCCRSV